LDACGLQRVAGQRSAAGSPQWLDRCRSTLLSHGPIDADSTRAEASPARTSVGVSGQARRQYGVAEPNLHRTAGIYSSMTTAPSPKPWHRGNLKRFVSRAHVLGQRVGSTWSRTDRQDSSDARKAPPDAWARNRDGSLCMSWARTHGRLLASRLAEVHERRRHLLGRAIRRRRLPSRLRVWEQRLELVAHALTGPARPLRWRRDDDQAVRNRIRRSMPTRRCSRNRRALLPIGGLDLRLSFYLGAAN